MRVLLSNDDGILSPGLWALARALREVGEVVVVAPDREQSGVGTSVTLHQPVRATEVPSPVEGVRAFAVEGTPSDCVILALTCLLEGPVDVVVSGANLGANLGTDVMLSGTVAAALQGYLHRLPSLAVSITAVQDLHYRPAAVLTRLLVQGLLESRPPRPILLNLNVPNLPMEQLKGVRVTHLGRQAYADAVQVGDDGRRRWFWISRGRPQWEREEEATDIWAVRNGFASITPLVPDLTDEALLPAMEGLARRVEAAFRALAASGG